MASPANRRSGFSRRAQYTTFLSFVAAVLGGVLGLALLVVSIVRPQTFATLRGLADDAGRPVGEATAEGRAASRGIVATLSGYVRAGSEHARLERELDLAKTRLVEDEAMRAENARLKQILGIARIDGKPVAVARLTSSTASSTRRFATLGAGSVAGVTVGMPVRSQLGLVGRVLEVGARSARVMLVTDTESLVPVRRARDGIPAFAQGAGDGTLRIRLVNLGINPLKTGDVVVTSGSGGLYRPDTPVAVIVKVLRDGAIARVLSDPSATDYVLVENVWAPEAPPEAPEAGGQPQQGQGKP